MENLNFEKQKAELLDELVLVQKKEVENDDLYIKAREAQMNGNPEITMHLNEIFKKIAINKQTNERFIKTRNLCWLR